MPKTITLPVTAYRISSTPAGRKFGAPASLPIGTTHMALIRVPLDRIPRDATITYAALRIFMQKADANGGNLRVRPVNTAWSSSVTWPGPAVGSVLATTTPGSLAARQAVDLLVTPWAVTRNRNGLRLESSTPWPSGLYVLGSSAARDKPYMVITYTVPPDVPGTLVPDGGSVSVAEPILTYAGDEQMTQQQIQFSLTEGGSISYDTGWLAATSGRYDPATDPGANPTLVSGGAGIWWRVRTDGPDGMSAWSEWAYYEYDALPTGNITAPASTTIDGSPEIVWTTTSQQSFKIDITEGSTVVESSKWINEPATRNYVPGKAIKVPGHTGKITVSIRDAITPRVEAEGAPTALVLTKEFTTTLAGAETAITGLTATFDEPVVVLSGSVDSTLTPGMIGLFRDGVQVPIWDADGNGYLWAPIDAFVDPVTDTFVIKDFTAPLRKDHEWQVYVKDGGLPGPLTGPSASATLRTKTVWLVNPRDGSKVEVLGYSGTPAISQETEETGIVHVPISDGLMVESKRRRVVRSTRSGTIEGTVLNEHEDVLTDWVTEDSGLKYRLIFGKVNWPVILGDYGPQDIAAYPDGCGPDRILISLDWYQRLADL